MPDSGPQQDLKDATEARLCAYLEDELSPSEKAEIEQHLVANPQHRMLLADLARSRDWMRSLPRETSPVDLGEVFQGHVERQMLLDDSTGSSAGMSINRWPQYVLVAAVTVLMLGLGAVLIAILKSPSGGQTISSRVTDDGKIPFNTGLTPTTTPVEMGQAKSLASSSSADTTSLGTPSAAAVTQALPVRSDGLAAHLPGDEVDALKSRLSAAGFSLPADRKTVCFVVTADTPPAAMDQVRGFFDRHQIVFNAPSVDRQIPSYTNRNGSVGFGNARGDDPKDQIQSALTDNRNSGNNDGLVRSANQLQQNFRQQTQNVAGDQAGDPGDERAAMPGGVSRRNVGNTPDNTKLTLDQLKQIAPSSSDAMFVAPAMTPLQLELLNASLSSEALKQSVNRVTISEGPRPVGNTVPGTIAAGATMTITIPQLVGPGIEKTNVVKVGDDGNISLPMIDPVPAAGVTQEELQKRIAEKYREANLIDSAKVTIAVAATPPPQLAQQSKQATTRDAIAKATPAVPAASQPSDLSFVTVVVVVQPSKLPAVQTPASPVK